MSTRSTRYFEDPDERDGWAGEPKPWCPSCCVPLKSCGCPEAERILEQANIIKGTD